MGLLSFFKHHRAESAGAVSAPDAAVDSVQRARTRARQRLIGSAVLVCAGVLGFPVLFETQPRPLSANMPIEITTRQAVTAQAARSTAARAPATQAEPINPVLRDIIHETAADAGHEVAAAGAVRSAAPASQPVSLAPQPSAASSPAWGAAASKPMAAKAAPSAENSNASKQRAQALLNGRSTPGKKSEAASNGDRFIVQVGAFSDAAAARETRLKVEKLGLKTYTQFTESSAGSRIRVRVGPYASRAEAEKALAKIKAVGLSAAVFTL